MIEPIILCKQHFSLQLHFLQLTPKRVDENLKKKKKHFHYLHLCKISLGSLDNSVVKAHVSKWSRVWNLGNLGRCYMLVNFKSSTRADIMVTYKYLSDPTLAIIGFWKLSNFTTLIYIKSKSLEAPWWYGVLVWKSVKIRYSYCALLQSSNAPL